jgi:hypothetical protein
MGFRIVRGLSLIALLTAWLAAAAAWCDEPLPGIVFVSDEIFGPRHENPGHRRHGTNHWREGYIYHRATTQHPLERTTTPTRPGRNLYTLVPAAPDGRLTRITHLTEGEVFDPQPSYDGRTILFSMRRDGEDWFHLYEIGADGTGLTQLTDGPFNDVSGVYLPDGRIVFVSDRAGYLEEYHEERTETLWIMQADGTGIQQLTFNPGTVFDPTVLPDGRILFSLWDTFMLNIPPADKHETYLMTIRPDGTEEAHYFGAGEHTFFGRERHSGVALTQAGSMPDGTLLVQTELGPAIYDPSRGRQAADAISPIFPAATTVQLGGATHRVHLSPVGSRSTPYPLPDGRFLFAGTLPGQRDLGIYLGDPETGRSELLFNDPERAEFDPRPILLERPRPQILSSKSPSTATVPADERGLVPVTGRARFVVTNARRSDNPNHAAVLHRARYLRVIEALYTAVTSSSHTSLATRVLGEVPILPDGSVYFEAPGDTPLFLEPVDSAGRRLEFDWMLPETAVPVGSKQFLQEMTYITARSGEVKSCNGCHAPEHQAVGFRSTAQALSYSPVSVERDLTDLLYRRNDPDEYRASARIGDSARYRSWLDSADPELRRRACEVLMHLEDESRPDAAAISRLLNDRSVAVRRAAARALARLGSVDNLPALLDRLDDRDWLVRFHAAAALESIIACSPGLEGTDDPGTCYRRLVSELGGHEGIRRALGEGPQTLQPWNGDGDLELRRRWFEAVGRLGTAAPESARRIVRQALDVPLPPAVRFEPWPGRRHPLEGQPPEIEAIRAAGWLEDAAAVEYLVPWLARHEYPNHVSQAALALGRIGTSEAVDALWKALRREVPDRRPFMTRYLQHGPQHEEYSMLRGLILAGAAPQPDDVPLMIALLPGTFLEKPRFEDRLRPESQRVLLGRLLLERAEWRAQAVAILVDVLRGEPPADGEPLYQKLLQGINLQRPFVEHGRPFPVVERIEPEQALWLLGCLATERSEVPERLIVLYLTSENWRERIDAAVLLNRLGFGEEAAGMLAAEAASPYPFGEIMGIGKSHYDTNFRDKCYLVMALAHHVDDVERLRTFADPRERYRDIRYGLAVGLGWRGRVDGIGILADLAAGDPISVIRREARQSLRTIQQRRQIAGDPVPVVVLPDALPYEAWYPPRGLTWPPPVEEPLPVPLPADQPLEVLLQRIAQGLVADNYLDLNNANNQAPGATHMMVRGMASLDDAVAQVAAQHPEAAWSTIERLMASPYPFAHYLALREWSAGDFPGKDGELAAWLEKCVRSSDTVRFYWTCEALANRRVTSAIGLLAELAHADSPPFLHGPPGMGHGYPAARALARLAGDADHPQVQRLLRSDNYWLRTGALHGLGEPHAECRSIAPPCRPLSGQGILAY